MRSELASALRAREEALASAKRDDDSHVAAVATANQRAEEAERTTADYQKQLTAERANNVAARQAAHTRAQADEAELVRVRTELGEACAAAELARSELSEARAELAEARKQRHSVAMEAQQQLLAKADSLVTTHPTHHSPHSPNPAIKLCRCEQFAQLEVKLASSEKQLTEYRAEYQHLVRGFCDWWINESRSLRIIINELRSLRIGQANPLLRCCGRCWRSMNCAVPRPNSQRSRSVSVNRWSSSQSRLQICSTSMHGYTRSKVSPNLLAAWLVTGLLKYYGPAGGFDLQLKHATARHKEGYSHFGFGKGFFNNPILIVRHVPSVARHGSAGMHQALGTAETAKLDALQRAHHAQQQMQTMVRASNEMVEARREIDQVVGSSLTGILVIMTFK